jgi:NTP pyrophosphatase (non-canonical NTP hydrolase)
MNLAEYQEQARATDQAPPGDTNALIVPLLGMAGEVGSLLQEYKKHLRDGDAHLLFSTQVAEELGDILWYLANTATKFGLDLAEIATANLEKTRDRWPPSTTRANPYQLLDSHFPGQEQLPRSFTAEIVEEITPEGNRRIILTIDGEPAGDPLKDNAYDDDGYRFHDVFHIAHAAMLGWSPVLRGKLLSPSRKRRSVPDVDEVEDGGRAIVLDEAIVAYVWEYARRHRFLDGVTTVDYPVLKTIRQLTSGLEVSVRSAHDWEEAILAGYRVFREIRARAGGVLFADLQARSIELVR